MLCTHAKQHKIEFYRISSAGLSLDQSDVCVLVGLFVFFCFSTYTSYIMIHFINTVCDKGSWCSPNKGDRTYNYLTIVRRFLGILTNVFKYLKGGCKESQALFSDAQCQNKRQWAQTATQKTV